MFIIIVIIVIIAPVVEALGGAGHGLAEPILNRSSNNK